MTVTENITGNTPHSLPQIKAHLRVYHDAEDSLIQAMYDSAITWMEARMRRYLIDRTLIITSADWFEEYLLPKKSGPIEVTAAIYTDSNDDTINHAAETTINGNAIETGCQPSDFKEDLGITLTADAFTNGGINQAILLLTTQWYENRGDQNIRGVPEWIDKICGTYAYQSF